MQSSPPILILGIGNMLLSDDGIGIHAVHELQKNPPPGVVLVDGGTAVLHALAFVEKAEQVLVLDALRTGAEPGSIRTVKSEEVAASDWRMSVHSLGLLEALKILSPTTTPPPITVLGIEPFNLDYGLELSPPVLAAMPAMISTARSIIQTWQDKRTCEPYSIRRPEHLERPVLSTQVCEI